VGKGVDGDRIISEMLGSNIFAIAREASASGWTNDYLKLGPQADACLSGSLPVELTFRDNGPGVGPSRSVAKNVVSSKAPAKAKGKMKAGPSRSIYVPLYKDDDEAEPVSDFEPIKDASDTGPTTTAESQDHNQARLTAMLAVWEKLAKEHVLHGNDVLATETIHFLSLVDIEDRVTFEEYITNSDEPKSREKAAFFGKSFWTAYSDATSTTASSSKAQLEARISDLRDAFSFNGAS
jgi:bloom syndrome protein